MIDTKEMRELASAYVGLTAWTPIPPQELIDFLDRLEAAEEERDNLRALVVMRFDHDYPPQFTQGHNLHELNEPVTAEHCRWFVAEIERLRTDCNALRAKVAEMEKQKPVGVRHGGSYYGEELQDWEFEANQCACDKLNEAYVRNPTSLPLYALPGAQAQPAPSIPESVMEVLAGLVYEVELNICPHEETHRGGQWEICDMCGARWADDRGGKPEFKWPEVVEKARDMLAAAPEAKP